MIIVATALLLLACSSTFARLRTPGSTYPPEFEKYIKDFGKVYASAAEKAERFLIFTESQKRIQALNAMNQQSVPEWQQGDDAIGCQAQGMCVGSDYASRQAHNCADDDCEWNQCCWKSLEQAKLECSKWDACKGFWGVPKKAHGLEASSRDVDPVTPGHYFARGSGPIALGYTGSKHWKKTSGQAGDASFGLTFTSDRYPHEKPKRGRKGYGSTQGRPEVAVAAPSVTALPKGVDWRRSRAVTPVKNQGQCGSCWAFSTAETVESAYYLSKVGAEVPILFSPQQVASCVTTMDGCGGGDTAVAFNYLKGEKYGLAPASFWEYAQGLTPANSCSAKSCTQSCKSHDLKTTVANEFYIGPSAHVKGFSYATPTCASAGSCQKQDLHLLAANLATHGPVSVCVNAGVWDDYKGGVLTQKACGGYGYDDLDHCVQLVGFNTTAPKPYWIVRNSWATSWGLQGYVHLEYGKNTCGLADEAILAQIKAADTPEVHARMNRLRNEAMSF